jgi:UDP-N-acetylmuramate--alanine ligase
LYRSSGLDPSFVVGAHVAQLDGGSGVGMGEHFIVEACEYDRSFLHLAPKLAAILNIEADHLDCYLDLDDIVSAFRQFAATLPEDGLIVAPSRGGASVEKALSSAVARVETVGLDDDADWRAADVCDTDRGQSFDVMYEGTAMFSATLPLSGRHNVTNALAAIALAFNGGATRETLIEGLATFRGVDRRMTEIGSGGGVTIVDDYAHHPTEVRVTLDAVRRRYTPRRLWVVFQPHQHSRTRLLMNEFAECFNAADEVIIPRIYRSRDSQEDIDAIRGETLATRIGAHGVSARHVAELTDIAELLESEWSPGDVVVTMGAGDIWKLANDLARRIQRDPR